jgi:arylsulfatase
LEAIGVEPPRELGGVEQRPLEGVSFAYAFDEPEAPERHTTQYYEMFGCRAIYHEGWKAVVYHPIQDEQPGLDIAEWELYDLRADPAECHDLAAERPERLRALVERWWAEAERYQVLPLDNRPFSDLVLSRPPPVPERQRYVYWPGRAPVPENVAAPTKNRPHTIAAVLRVDHGSELGGVLAVQGSVLGGWSFHIKAGTLVYVHNLSGWREYRVTAPLPALAPGEHRVAFRFTPGQGGPHRGELLVDDEVVGTGEIKRAAWSRYSITGHGLTVGHATGIPPCDRDYRAPFAFGPALDRVEIDVGGTATVDSEATVADIMASQ